MASPDPETADIDVFEALSTAVLVLNTDLEVLRVNSAARSMLAASDAKIRGASLSRLLPGADELVAAARRAQLEERQFSERGIDLRLGGRGQTVVDCTITPLWLDGPSPTRVLIELSEREHHLRIQLEGSLLQQNNASSALLRGLAHEIKNPLGGIRGAAQLLEREFGEQRLVEYTQVIIYEADRLRELVDRMLGPRGESRMMTLNIHDVLEHVIRVVDAESGGAAAVQRDYDPSLPSVYADRDEMIQAFLNLVRNGLRAVDGRTGGQVTLRTRIQRQFTIGAKVHRLVVRVHVIDTGAGVDPELGSSIFFPLVSGHADGSGLGLPMAQSLIHRQGGMIGFESEPGHTDFSVWLPLGETR